MKAALARLSHYFWRTTADQCDEDLLALSGLPQLRGHLQPGHPHRPGRHHHRGHLHPGHLHRPGRDHLRGNLQPGHLLRPGRDQLRGCHHLDYVNAVNPHSIEDLHVSSQN